MYRANMLKLFCLYQFFCLVAGLQVLHDGGGAIIYPGTKWCGKGNIAKNDNDFGIEKSTDLCCKQHDYCPDYIDGNGKKYSLMNSASYTRLSCDCDKKFFKCLKSVNTETSNQVGKIYFDLLQTQCFKNEYPIIRCANYKERKCSQYTLDKTKNKKYQWFDDPFY